MNIDAVREYCLSFPDATEGLQWGDNLLFRIRGKIFATVPLDAVAPSITLKSTPEKVAELLEIDGIERAAYVGRYDWISVEGFDVVPWSELKELIRQSYELVAAKAPRKTTKTLATRSRRKRLSSRAERSRAKRDRV